MRAALSDGLRRLGLPLDASAQERLCAFGEAVIRQNQVMNLTAITEPAAVAELHLLDSLTLLRAEPLAGKSLLDVGTGAGFPGVPLKLAEPTIRLTLLDSLQKRLRWLEQEALPALGVDARFLCGRAEDFARSHRESFDVVTSRAVARLNVLCELCLPFVRVGGCLLAMKGQSAADELSEAERAICLLGARHERTETYEIAGAQHRVIVLRKLSPTPPGYPRPYAKIKQRPL